MQIEIENSDKIRAAYEKLLQKVNKKKRHVGIGSHNVWQDPIVEGLETQVKDTQDENEALHQAIERINHQREVRNIPCSWDDFFKLFCLYS